MSVHPESAAELILAVDAGGTKTVACFAREKDAGNYEILGRGRAGGANPLSVGLDSSIAAISSAVAAAAADADLHDALAARAVLAVAGAADPTMAGELVRRASKENWARQIAVVSDILPVIAAGFDRAGIALIAGTGSVAYARAEDGRTIRCGGWGYLLGDDGGGFAIGRAALRFALRDLETNHAPHGALTTLLLDELQAKSAADLIAAIYSNATPRAVIASLARCVALAAEKGDPAAEEIVKEAARELTRLATRAARSLSLDLDTIPLAFAGGVLVGSAFLRDAVAAQLAADGLRPQIRLVADPLDGCLRLTAAESSGSVVHWH